jgi:predicted choloylglycine hydrolase
MLCRELRCWIAVIGLVTFSGMAQESKPPVDQPAGAQLVTPVVIGNPETHLLDEEGPGKLYQVGEHLVCVLEGTPEELGYQHGRLLAKHIQDALKRGYMVKALYERGYTKAYINAQSERMEKHFPAEYVAELQGVLKGLKAAQAEDVTYEELRAAVTQAELSHHDPNAPPGCSNFAVWGKWTKDGRLLHGRNLDWSITRGAQDHAVILVYRPKGGIPFMMVGWAGAIGSVSGMNARGITIGEMTSSSTDETFDGLPLMLIMRRVLDSAKTLDEAVAILQRGPRTLGWNFIVGDAKTPEARALEVDAKDCDVFTAMDPKENGETGHRTMPDAVRRTNHPCGMTKIRKVVALYGPRFGIPTDNIPAVVPVLKQQNTWQRYDFLGKQIEAHAGIMDVFEALQLIVTSPVGNGSALHSWVFDPKNRVAYVSNAGSDPPLTATSRPYTRIDVSPWFQ